MEHKIQFPTPFAHKHPPIININEIIEGKETLGVRMSDRFAHVVGSWRFIIIQSVILSLWVAFNVLAWTSHWDPYPFIFMNLVLSLQAAYAAPILMMAQNRMSERDRLDAHNDYLINVKSEEEVRLILEHLEAQNQALVKIYEVLSVEKRGE